MFPSFVNESFTPAQGNRMRAVTAQIGAATKPFDPPIAPPPPKVKRSSEADSVRAACCSHQSQPLEHECASFKSFDPRDWYYFWGTPLYGIPRLSRANRNSNAIALHAGKEADSNRASGNRDTFAADMLHYL
jgi:hypothetical protein